MKLPGDASGVFKPYIPVRYHYKSSFTQEILTLIDSGADTSYFSTDLADFFHIDWKKLKVQKSNAANNSTFLAYIFEEPFVVEIGGNELTLSKAFFSPELTPPFPFILGQDNFFGLCRISFERYKWNIELKIK